MTGRKVKTVPQVYLEGEYIGGYDDLMKYFDANGNTEESEECTACEG